MHDCSKESVEFVVSPESRLPRIPRPPSRLNVSCSDSSECVESLVSAPGLLKVAPPPPPPPPKGLMAGEGNVRRVPEVVEFYHSLMRRDSRRYPGGGGGSDGIPVTATARNMIGEIENRSAYLLAVSTISYPVFINYYVAANFTSLSSVLLYAIQYFLRLMKVQVVNEVNKVLQMISFCILQYVAYGEMLLVLLFIIIEVFSLLFMSKDFVIEALRSIAELITYGDQHDATFFE